MAFNIAPGGCYGGGYGNYWGGGQPSRWDQGQYQQNSTDIRTGGGNHFWRERGHFWATRAPAVTD